jgi:DNA-binding XRE family transcriptional regulator
MSAPKGNQFAQGNKGGGRLTDYKQEYAKIAYAFCLLGSTDAELAEYLDVSEQTINNWKLAHEEFSLALKNGKSKADSEVANKLYERALGATWTEQTAFKVRNQSGSGVFTEEVVVVDLQKAAPPDTPAISLWLRNRKADKWKDKQEVDHTSKGKQITFTPALNATSSSSSDDDSAI